jgi:Ser/Thr protein kinase RdoA (MazF antagonist)
MATGVAAVVEGADRAVFVKALDAVDNPKGAGMYRTEAEIAGRLPSHPAIPALLDAGCVEVPGGWWWVTLFEARPGTTPQHPWRSADLDPVLGAWQELRPFLEATPWTESAGLSDLFVAWREIAADPTDPWHRLALQWAEREAAMVQQVDGGAEAQLSHIDLRADNILVDAESGIVSFVDWAHPGTAAPWADVALLLGDVVASGADVEAGGGIDVVARFACVHPDTDPELAVSLISALGAFMHTRAGREQNPAIPHRRTWMRAASEQMLPFITEHTADRNAQSSQTAEPH